MGGRGMIAAVTEFVRVAMQVCCIQRDVQKGTNLLSHFSSILIR